jgi:hypothetical protein
LRPTSVRRQLLVAAAAVDCHYFEWADFTPLDRWIDVLTKLLNAEMPYLSTADALRVRGALLIALLFRQPDNPGIDDAATTVEALLESSDILGRARERSRECGVDPVQLQELENKGTSADALIARVEPWLPIPRSPPSIACGGRLHRAFNEQIRGHYVRSQKIMKDTEEFAAAHGLKLGPSRDLPRRTDGARIERGQEGARPRLRSCARC